MSARQVMRNERVLAERRAGRTFQALADECGVTRERARQIVLEEERREAGRRRAYVRAVLYAIRRAAHEAV